MLPVHRDGDNQRRHKKSQSRYDRPAWSRVLSSGEGPWTAASPQEFDLHSTMVAFVQLGEGNSLGV